MQLRLLVLGICSSLVLTSSALAAPAQANASIAPPVAERANVVHVAAPKADAGDVKKKKTKVARSKSRTKLARPMTAEEKKLAAKAKAEEARKLAKAKAEEHRKAARAKAEEARQVARAKAAEDRKAAAVARTKAAEARLIAREKAANEKRLAKLQAAEARRQAIAQAEEVRRQAEKARRQAELAQLASLEIARTGNNGELRSELPEVEEPRGLFANLFGGPIKTQSMRPETRALDAAMEQRVGSRKFQVKSEFEPQAVRFHGYPRGTIVIDTSKRFLYLVESSLSARRYAIAVGREGLEFKGTGKIGDKQEWPRWIPTKEMQEREPKKYGRYKDGMPGGADNPLGARAMYLYQGKKDTHIRIHGTNQPQTIGTNSSNGCFRMVNEHVMDLYNRVRVGTDVIVM